MQFIIYGIDANGGRHELARTRFAATARDLKAAKAECWAQIEVVGSEGEVSEHELDRLADIEYRYP